MRHFLLKISVALLIAFAMHFAAGYFSGGKTDDYYLRFTTPSAKSMIIGSSRAAQGIQPDSLNEVCKLFGYDTPIFNFAFTSMASPYGEIYTKTIQSKLDTSTNSGLFIVCVEPYMLGGLSADNLVEKNGPLNDLHFLKSYPNWEYLLKRYSYGWGRMALTSLGLYNSTSELHSNGWLEINVIVDSVNAKNRAYDVLHDKRNDIGKFSLSPYRLHWLRETITLLQRYGNVVLVRVPVSREFYEFEQLLSPAFDQTMLEEARYHQIVYKNFQDQSESLTFKDGHHMQLTSTARFSSTLKNWLRQEGITHVSDSSGLSHSTTQ